MNELIIKIKKWFWWSVWSVALHVTWCCETGCADCHNQRRCEKNLKHIKKASEKYYYYEVIRKEGEKC